MDDATLVTVAAAQYVRDMGTGAIRYLREMQELATSLPDPDSARTWGDIKNEARAILLAATADSSRPAAQAARCAPVPLG